MKKCIVLSLSCLVLFVSSAFAEVDMAGNGEGALESAPAPSKIAATDGATLVSSCASPVSGNDGLAWDGSYLWIADYNTKRAYKVNPSTCQSVSSIPLPGTYPMGLAWDGSYLWFSDANGGMIYQLNPSNGNIISSFTSQGDFPTGLAFDGTRLWNADTDCNSASCTPDEIHKLTTTGTLLATFSAIGTYPTGLAYDGANLWHSDNVTDTIYKLNPTNLSVLDSFPAPGTYPNDLAWDGRYLWVVDNGTDMLYKYDVGMSATWGTAYNTLFESQSDLELFRQYRDEILSKTSKGTMYTALIYLCSEEALEVLINNPELMMEAKYLIDVNKEAVSEVLIGNEGVIYNTEEIVSFLDAYAKKSPPDLRIFANVIKERLLRKQAQNGFFLGFRLE